MNAPWIKERVYGEIPARFDVMLRQTLDREPTWATNHRRMPALVLAICLLVLSGAALAVAQGLGLVDFFGVGAVNREQAAEAITAAVPQSGGDTAIANLAVREVYYDGVFLRYIVDAQPKGDAWLEPSGIALRSDLPLSFPEMATETRREGAGLVFATTALLPPELRTETIPITLMPDMTGEALTFTVERTATPEITRYAIDQTLELVHIQAVSVLDTPFETVVSVTYRKQLAVFPGFRPVPADGQVSRWRPTIDRGYYEGIEPTPEGFLTQSYLLPAEAGDDSTLTLLIGATDQALVIDRATGRSAVHPYRVVGTGEAMTIEINEGETP
ncbi:MAG: hypothetical protein LBN04_04320 [Oscillospiraceae bacterium]|nr:hypothetical protein [Oscillospiraceae bacterium]